MKASGGYTFHEHYDHLGLINMNGRVYDPVVGRFLSVDPVVGNPLSAQDYNGYSYCANNPMKYTDPSGYTYLSVMLERGGVFAYRGSYINGGEGTRGGGSASYYAGGSSYGLPGSGGNGSGAGGYYYDYASGTYRATASQNEVSFGEVNINYVKRYGQDRTAEFKQYLTNLQYQRNSGALSASRGGFHCPPPENTGPSFWDYVRLMDRINNAVPDAVSISLNGDFYCASGGSVGFAGYLIMLNGADVGKSIGFTDAGGGLGTMGATATFVLTKYYYIGGDINNLFMSDIGGKRTSINIGAGEGIVGGVGLSWMSGHNGDGVIFGISYGVGVGAWGTIIGGNINVGGTILWK